MKYLHIIEFIMVSQELKTVTTDLNMSVRGMFIDNKDSIGEWMLNERTGNFEFTQWGKSDKIINWRFEDMLQPNHHGYKPSPK